MWVISESAELPRQSGRVGRVTALHRPHMTFPACAVREYEGIPMSRRAWGCGYGFEDGPQPTETLVPPWEPVWPYGRSELSVSEPESVPSVLSPGPGLLVSTIAEVGSAFTAVETTPSIPSAIGTTSANATAARIIVRI